MPLDLAVTNGVALIPESGMARLDIGVSEGKVVALVAPGTLPRAKRTVDAEGLIVAPGIIDPHSHFGAYVPLEQDLEHETRAAIAGGITSIGWFIRSPESYLEVVPKVLSQAAGRFSADFFIHPIISTEGHLAELDAVADRFGINSFKAYMAKGAAGVVTDDFLLRLFRGAAGLPRETTVCVHAENDSLVAGATARAAASATGTATLADWSEARPDFAEEEAIARAAFLAEVAGARVYFVHLNSAREVLRVRLIKRQQTGVFSEAGSHYLSLTTDHPLGILVKRNPPLRSPDDVEALWNGVRDGTIDTLGTDNVVGSSQINNIDAGMYEARVGFTALGTHLPVALHEGHHVRGIDIIRLIHAMTAAPARIFGLYPRKGTIQIGSDADLVVIDPALEKVVDHAQLHTWSDFSPWDGMSLRGWPIMTILGGEVVAERGEVVADGRGSYLGVAG